MSVNQHFAESVLEHLGPGNPGKLMFLCRSGVRSLYAADAVGKRYAQLGISADCKSVAEGFEGDKDESGRRGARNGWKYRGLAWSQS